MTIAKSENEINIITKRRLDKYCFEECSYLNPNDDDPCMGCKVLTIIDILTREN